MNQIWRYGSDDKVGITTTLWVLVTQIWRYMAVTTKLASWQLPGSSVSKYSRCLHCRIRRSLAYLFWIPLWLTYHDESDLLLTVTANALLSSSDPGCWEIAVDFSHLGGGYSSSARLYYGHLCFCKSTCQIHRGTFLFDMCHRSSAAATPVQYQRDI